MKILKKILAYVPLLLLSSTLFAPIIPTNNSQLNPYQPIFFPKNPNDSVTIAGLDGTALATRTSNQTLNFNQLPFGLAIEGHTILNPLVFNVPNLNDGSGITIQDDGTIYYFSTISFPNFDSTDKTKPLGDFLTKFILDHSKMTDNILRPTIVIDKLITKDSKTFTVTIRGKYIIYTDEKNSQYIYSIKSNKLQSDPFGFTYGTTINNVPKVLANARLQALKEQAEVDQMQGINSISQAKLEALNQIDRLKGATLVRTLNAQDSLTLFNGVRDYIANNNNEPLSPEFLLDLSSKELGALYYAVAQYKSTTPAIDFSPTLTMIKNEEIRRTLQETLAGKSAFDKKYDNASGISVVDWYSTLSPNEQIMIKFDLYEALDDGTLFTKDPNELNATERSILREYILETLSLATLPTQIADLKAKLQTVTEQIDLQKLGEALQQALKDKALKISEEDFDEFADNTADLSFGLKTEERDSALDLAINSITLARVLSGRTIIDSTNIVELTMFKIEVQKFLNSSSADQFALIQEAKTYAKTTSTDLTKAVSTANNYVNTLDFSIQNKFSNLSVDDQVTLLSSVSDNIYAEIFRNLSFATQKTLTGKLSSLENAQNTLITYQNYLLSERINTARTTADLTAIQADMKAAGLNWPDTTTQISFNNKMKDLQAAQNKRIADGAPSIPNAGSTGKIDLNPMMVDPVTGGTVVVHDKIDPTTGNTTPEVVPAQNTPDKPYDKDKDLEEAREEAYQKEQDRIAADKAKQEFNKEAKAKDEPTRRLK